MAEAFKVGLNAELVIGGCVAEVETGRNGEVCLEDETELGHDALAAWAGVTDEHTCFGGVIDALCGVNKFAELESGGPHGSTAACNGCFPVPIVEKLVGDESTSETEKTEFDATCIDAAGRGFVEDMEVFDFVSAVADFFEDSNVFAGAPDGVDGNLKLYLAGEEEGEFGEEGDVDGVADGLGGRVWG